MLSLICFAFLIVCAEGFSAARRFNTTARSLGRHNSRRFESSFDGDQQINGRSADGPLQLSDTREARRLRSGAAAGMCNKLATLFQTKGTRLHRRCKRATDRLHPGQLPRRGRHQARLQRRPHHAGQRRVRVLPVLRRGVECDRHGAVQFHPRPGRLIMVGSR